MRSNSGFCRLCLEHHHFALQTVGSAGVTDGAKSVTICGVTLNAFAADSATGIKVSTPVWALATHWP